MGSARKLVANLFISLDGVVEEQLALPVLQRRDGRGRQRRPQRRRHHAAGPEDLRRPRRGVAGARGRGGEDAEFAKLLGDSRKIVVSRQQLEFTWRNSERSKATSSRP